MPIAINMSSRPESGATSPISSRMTKAAFFRARSPPIDRFNGSTSPNGYNNMSTEGGYGNLNDLAGRFDAATRLEQSSAGAGPSTNSRYSPNDQQQQERAYTPTQYSDNSPLSNLEAPQAYHHNDNSNGYFDSSPATDGHAPTLDRVQNPPSRRGPSPVRRRSTTKSQRKTAPITPNNLTSNIHGAMTAPESSYSHDQGTYENGYTEKDNAIMGFAQGSDEMLLALLAGQAAVDCERLPIGGWEEVEGWKKELSILSNRLESLQSRHQREIKILTAAKTLQKLNNSNKRMSRQTMESLEQAEKRVEAAEKEVYVLQDREAGLRRRLMEHWSGVMAWEVRRLEKSSAETQLRYDEQSMKINELKDREAELIRQVSEKQNRVQELEEMVIEMGRRERAIEEEIKEIDQHRLQLQNEQQTWSNEREAFKIERDNWTFEKKSWNQERSKFENERSIWNNERNQYENEKRHFMEERTNLLSDRQRLMTTSSQATEKDRATMDQIRLSLGSILNRKMGSVNENEVLPSLEEIKNLISRREREVVNLRDEMKEVNMGLEEELKRVGEDRNVWKTKLDQAETARREENMALTKKIRNQQDQINDLSLRNESLSSSLKAAQTAVTTMSRESPKSPSSSASDSSNMIRTLQSQVDGLTGELESIANQFNSIWSILPSSSKRIQADLIDSITGNSNSSLSSPSKNINFSALQDLYIPHNEKVGNINETLIRIKGVIEDSKILVERVIKMTKERELLKGNAAKAKKLVEESTKSLETYQQQVAVLEDQLAKSGSTESHFLDELNDLQMTLDSANQTKRQLESKLKEEKEINQRLNEVNEHLSSKTLDLTQQLALIEDQQQYQPNSSISSKEELNNLKKKLKEAEQEQDEERMKSQSQRIQLLDELNSLQAEVGDLRKQLRSKA
ncbi:uncharacterized protein L201_002786 [Kwoniella dendrophila CBS 6074]|uniref:Up-regulated during septation protein 1 domain-containing protein n=1 Tax=Kwoniella dendrophila CBS 6074 TaxID=1295534 RepID=A0AAX4JSL2_9TREE